MYSVSRCALRYLLVIFDIYKTCKNWREVKFETASEMSSSGFIASSFQSFELQTERKIENNLSDWRLQMAGKMLVLYFGLVSDVDHLVIQLFWLVCYTRATWKQSPSYAVVSRGQPWTDPSWSFQCSGMRRDSREAFNFAIKDSLDSIDVGKMSSTE